MTENDYEKMKEQTRVLLESIEVPPELQRGNRPDPASDVGTSESTGAGEGIAGTSSP
jgi:hypothetical protein